MYSRRWLIAALVTLGLASACSDFNTNLSLQTSSSTLSYVSPATQTAGGSDFTITATGTGFVNTGTYILWNGIQLTDTVYVSSTTLTAVVPAADIATPGPVQIAIQIPGSAVSGTTNVNNNYNYANTTEVSNIIFFTVNAAPGPLPVVSSVSASTTSMPATPYCSPNGLTLTVTGQNFDNTSTVNWNGSPRTTTFVSATQLTASILATDTAFPGTAGVSVSSSAGPSNSMPFTMTTPSTSLPLPGIISIAQNIVPPVGTPTSVPAGTATFTLSVAGSSFVPCSVVRWSGSPLVTTYVSQTQISALVPASDVFTPGTADVTVFTLIPGGGATAPVTFTVTPAP